MPQLTIAILKKAYPKQNMGTVHLTLMTTQYLRDFMFYCAECEYMRVNYSFANPTEIKLTASENTNEEKLDAFLLLLKEMKPKTACAITAEIYGVKKNALYDSQMWFILHNF